MNQKNLSETFVKNAVIKWLSKNGWGHLEFDELHKHGVDIRAKKGIRRSRIIFVEVKGDSESKSGNEVRFIYGLGQLVTRMKVVDAKGAYTYALAAPAMVSKIALRRIPWQFAKKLCLEIFEVSADEQVKRYTWQDFRRKQS